jgi:L-iditol 2-dehydrogenase
MATAVEAVIPAPVTSQYEIAYDPTKVLKHPEFAILQDGSAELQNKEANIACAYNEKHEVTMMKKPVPKPGKGECVVHVRATGICG